MRKDPRAIGNSTHRSAGLPTGLFCAPSFEFWRRSGAATAEYAVVLVAATGFAAVLVAILKSDAIKTLLTNIIKQALKVG